MGAYFIALSNQPKEDRVSVFEKRGQKSSFSYRQNGIRIVKYAKTLFPNDPWFYEDEQQVIVAHGTLSYAGQGVVGSFNSLVTDLKNERTLSQVYGHFSIVRYIKNSDLIKIYFDEAGYGAPYVLNNELISTSFLACSEAADSLTLNKEAIFEQVYTGCYFNNDTTFKEISRITSTSTLEAGRITVQFIQLENSVANRVFTDRSSAVESQINEIGNYLEGWLPQINTHFSDLGLSSGYDSRLLLALIDRMSTSYQVHCYWKPIVDFDSKVAMELAKVVNKPLVRVAISQREQIDLDSLIQRAFWYYDGLFPSNHGWVREYRTSKHRSEILGKTRFGLSGISGEQYRNEFQLLNKKYTLRSVIKSMVLQGLNYEVLVTSNYKEEGIKRLEHTLRKGLSLATNVKRIDRLEIQRFYCEMWVKGGPGIRNQVENQLTYFLSPFADRYLQKYAYQAIPHIGYGGRFQAQMITMLNSRLASILSDYGFTFNKVPFKHDLSSIVGSVFGIYTKRKLAALIRRNKHWYLDSFGTHKLIVSDKLNYLRKYSFPFPVDHPKFKADTIDRLIALSTLLEHFKVKIE